uniref:nuclear transport factor 2 family protein n=1 Tax=Fulvivirga sp. TaxID=1931237 RepID=UPI0040491839
MKFSKTLLAAIILCLFQAGLTNAQEATQEHKDSLNTIVKVYYDLNLRVFQADSKVEDIDRIFQLFTDDFTYVHPKYGGTYTREDLYNGYLRNQKNGGYDGSVVDIKILNKISGLKAVTVEKRFVTKENGQLTESESQMTLFEFKDGKISRIFEYW